MRIEFIQLDAANGALKNYGTFPDRDFQALEADGVIALRFPQAGVVTSVTESGQTTLGLDLALLKPAATAWVNERAGAFRARFITDIPGQDAVYLLKEQEARAWATGADLAAFPYLAAEAAGTGATVDAVAALVLATAAQWNSLSPKIEGARRGACSAIAAAAAVPQIVAAMQVVWDSLTEAAA